MDIFGLKILPLETELKISKPKEEEVITSYVVEDIETDQVLKVVMFPKKVPMVRFFIKDAKENPLKNTKVAFKIADRWVDHTSNNEGEISIEKSLLPTEEKLKIVVHHQYENKKSKKNNQL